MKVFISGPMSGKPNSNKEAFFKAQGELMSHGYSVWNPAWFVDHCAVAEFSKDALQAISNEVLRHCDAIYMLKGWMHSEGAWNEHEIAEARELVIMYEGKCCWDKEPEDEHDVLKRHIKTVEEALAWERWKNRLPDSLDSNKNKVDSLEKQYKDLAEDVEDCKNDLDILFNNAFTGLEKRLDIFNNARKEDIQELFDDMEDRKKDISEQDRRLDCHHNRLMSLSERVNTLSKKCNKFDEDIKEIKDKLECIIEENRHYRLSVTEQLGTIRSRLKTIDNLENTNEALERRIKAIEKRLSIKPFYAPTEDEKDDD